MSGLTLIVLAAGLGRRFGGPKQLAAVGPSGETLLEYTLYDAARAGFTRAVLVLRPGMDAPRVGAIEVATVHQDEPWGTAHAVLAAERAVQGGGAFAVANADDCYGRDAIAAIARFLGAGTEAWAVAGYRLADTLSASGGVNRAVCRTDAAGWLTGIEEVTNVVRAERDDDLVSMNLWAFTPAVFGVLGAGFAQFRKSARDGDEYILPNAVAEAVAGGKARVKVLAVGSQWIGMTHPGDRPRVQTQLAALVQAGAYPSPLWR